MAAADPVLRSEPFTLPAELPMLRLRLTLRLLEDATLPAFKGAMLRGGFGYAFQRACCPQPCWGRSEACAVAALCPYRLVFETPRPPDVSHLHDLQDVPRPFVIEPPTDVRTSYHGGDVLEFVLVLIGRGVDHLPYFLYGFQQLGQMGLGRNNARARLERVEALEPFKPTGAAIYQDGRALATADHLPLIDADAIARHGSALPADMRLTLQTPLRVKSRGAFIEALDLPAIVQALCWRLNALSTFHGAGPWPVDHRALVEQARAVVVEDARVRWADWERTSTREPQRQSMKLGGIVGSAVLRGVTADVRALLVAGSLTHVGKACVFGHGGYELRRM